MRGLLGLAVMLRMLGLSWVSGVHIRGLLLVVGRLLMHRLAIGHMCALHRILLVLLLMVLTLRVKRRRLLLLIRVGVVNRGVALVVNLLRRKFYVGSLRARILLLVGWLLHGWVGRGLLAWLCWWSGWAC